MQEVLRITFLLALSIAAAAQQSSAPAGTNPAAESEIKALELKLAVSLPSRARPSASNLSLPRGRQCYKFRC